MAPLSPNRVSATCSSLGSKMARIKRNADVIWRRARDQFAFSIEAGTFSHRCGAGDPAEGSEHKVGVLIGQKRYDQVRDPQTEEAPGKDRFGRIQVRHTAPEEQERSESDRVGGLKDVYHTRTDGEEDDVVTHDDPRGRLVDDVEVVEDRFGEHEETRITRNVEVLSGTSGVKP